MKFDLTAVLTGHAESVVAGPTVTSVDAALAAAERSGLRIERLIGLDRPTPECVAFFSQPSLSHWRIVDVYDFGDQGRTRNALIEAAQGRWIAIFDGDDLVSENWISAAAQTLADRRGARVIVHPELNWVFDAGAFVLTKPAQDDPLFTPYYFCVANYYDAMCVAPKDAFLEHPYPRRAIPDGFAFEDWQWAADTMAGGWRHVVASDTIIFKRRRDASQTHESRARGATIRQLDALCVDRVSGLHRSTGGDGERA